MPLAEVLPMRDYTLRDIPSVLRKIAEQIESGEFPSAKACAVVVSGETLDVCLAGEVSSYGDAHMLLHAGMLALADSAY